MRALPGDTLAMYGTESVRVKGLIADATSYVHVVDRDGEVTGVPLPRVKTTTPAPGAVGEPPDRASYWPGLAWDPSHDRLYVAHADKAEITAVDVAKARVAVEAPIRPRRSPAEALAAWLVPTAEAKGPMPGGERQALVSPDGATMYVTGSRTDLTRLGQDRWHERRTPYGVSVISTDNFTERNRVEGMFEAVAQSRDGTRFLATGRTWEGELGGTDWTGSYNGLTLFKAPGLDVVAHLWPEADVGVFGFSADGTHAYVVWCQRPTLEEVSGTLASIDIASGAVVAERRVPSCSPTVLAPVGSQGQS
jgi:DNA-binding beta-propeller fold protein YncE